MRAKRGAPQPSKEDGLLGSRAFEAPSRGLEKQSLPKFTLKRSVFSHTSTGTTRGTPTPTSNIRIR